MKQEAKNILWVLVTLTAAFAGICGIFVNGWKAIVEAISIFGFVIMIIAIAAYFDYVKDSKFIALQSLTKDEDITVIRGKYYCT